MAYLTSVPDMMIYAPSNFSELRSMLRQAVLEEKGPVAVRYPRGGEGAFKDDTSDAPAVLLRDGGDVTIVSYGIELNAALDAAERLSRENVGAAVLKLNRLAPLDTELVRESVSRTGRLMVAEDVCRSGGMGEKLLAALAEDGVSLRNAALLNTGSGILPNGDPEDLRRSVGLDGAGIAGRVMEIMNEDKT